MSLRLSLLCLLTARPMTGYELAKQFDTSVAYLWHAPHSQIYPELRRMEAAGLVEAEELPRGANAHKRAYRTTAAGRQAIGDMIADVPPPAGPRDATLLRASYLELGTFEDARRLFRAHRDHHRREAARYRDHARRLHDRDTDLMRARLAASPRETHERTVAYKVHVYDGLAARSAAEVEWAEEGLALVERLTSSAGEATATPVRS